MNWESVTMDDVIAALREVDWLTPPRPLNEFFSILTLPSSLSNWNTRRFKCNLYYYRTNYFLLINFILGQQTRGSWISFLTELYFTELSDFSLAAGYHCSF